MMEKDRIKTEPTQLQLVNEINRVEQSRRRRTVMRRTIAALLAILLCAVLLMVLWFPVIVLDQGQAVVGMRGTSFQRDDTVIIRDEDQITICRIAAVSGEQIESGDLDSAKIPDGYYLIKAEMETSAQYLLVKEENIAAKILFTIWPLKISELFEIYESRHPHFRVSVCFRKLKNRCMQKTAETHCFCGIWHPRRDSNSLPYA